MKHWANILVLAFSILLGLEGLAQEPDYRDLIKWGPEFSVDRSFRLREVITLRDGSAAIIGANEDGLFHFKFSSDGSYLGAEKLLESELSLYGYISIGDSLFVLDAEQERNLRKISIRLYNLAASNSSEVLQTFVTRFEFSRKARNRLVWSVSNNAEHWMVSQQGKFSKGTDTQLEVRTFQLSTGDTGRLNLKLPYASDDFEYLDGLVSDSGTVFMSGKTGVQLNSPFRRKFLLFSYGPESKELREFNINPQDLFLQEVKLHASDSGVTAVGLYSQDPFADNQTSGYLLAELDSKGIQVRDKYIQAYSSSDISRNEVTGSVGRQGSIEDFFLQEMVPANGWYGVFEKRFLDQVCTTDPRTGIMDCTDQFNYLGLTVVNLENPGQSAFIDRRQLDFNTPGMYVTNVNLPVGDNLVVLYNDHFKNGPTSTDRVMNNATRSAIRAIIVGPDLGLSTVRLTSERQSDFVFVSKISCSGIDSGAYVLSSNGKQYRLGFLTYADLLK